MKPKLQEKNETRGIIPGFETLCDLISTPYGSIKWSRDWSELWVKVAEGKPELLLIFGTHSEEREQRIEKG